MSEMLIDGPADAEKELFGLLDYNGISYVREDGGARFLLSDRGFKWETACRTTGDGAVLIYGMYPFTAENSAMADRLCREVNSRVRYGAMFLQGDRLIFRTGADLFDIYSAYESIGRALEYNAGVIAEFWPKAAACRSQPEQGEVSEQKSKTKATPET